MHIKPKENSRFKKKKPAPSATTDSNLQDSVSAAASHANLTPSELRTIAEFAPPPHPVLPPEERAENNEPQPTNPQSTSFSRSNPYDSQPELQPPPLPAFVRATNPATSTATRVLVLFSDQQSWNYEMASAIASGVDSVPQTECILKNIEQVTLEELHSMHALILGGSIHLGGIDWKTKKFMDTICNSASNQNLMVGKVGGVFVTGNESANVDSGPGLTFVSLLSNLASLGMIMVPLPKNTPGFAKGGIPWGPLICASEKTSLADTNSLLEAARVHGANIARIAVTLEGKTLFAHASNAAMEQPHSQQTTIQNHTSIFSEEGQGSHPPIATETNHPKNQHAFGR